MKKRFLSVFLMVLSLILCLGLAACNDDKDKSDATTTKTTTITSKTTTSLQINNEVTNEQWQRALTGVNNYTYSLQRGSATQEIKVTQEYRYQSITENNVKMEQIFTKEDNKYISYENTTGSWTKNLISEETYLKSEKESDMCSYFKDDYNSFTYADGKYTAASLDKTDTMNAVLTDVEITFKNGELFEIKFKVSTMDITIDNIGTTIITLPVNYTDNTNVD